MQMSSTPPDTLLISHSSQAPSTCALPETTLTLALFASQETNCLPETVVTDTSPAHALTVASPEMDVTLISLARMPGSGSIRTLPDVVEEIEVPLPAVVAVTPECAYPRIAGMREILTAGKKPATVTSAADAGVDVSAAVEIASVTAPEQAARKRQVFDMKNDGDFDAFASAVAAAVRA